MLIHHEPHIWLFKFRYVAQTGSLRSLSIRWNQLVSALGWLCSLKEMVQSDPRHRSSTQSWFLSRIICFGLWSLIFWVAQDLPHFTEWITDTVGGLSWFCFHRNQHLSHAAHWAGVFCHLQYICVESKLTWREVSTHTEGVKQEGNVNFTKPHR